MSEPIAIAEQLKRGPLREVIERAELLERLNQQLQTQIGEPLSSHCRLANIRSQCAIIQCDSPVWASKARFLIPDLIGLLNRIQQEVVITRVRIFITPDIGAPSTQIPRAQPPLSKASASLLASVALQTSDPQLSSALLRLSRHRN